MNEIVNMLMQKTGLSQEKAAVAVEVVVGYLKDKLPAPVAAQIQGLIAGGTSADASAKLGEAAQGLGGVFGKQ